jgi:probable rRNA maturation factor
LAVVVDVIDQTGWGQAQGPVIDLVEAVLNAEDVAGAVAVAFVDEATMAELNGRYRGLNEPTDVLSFNYAEDDAHWPGRLGPGPGAEGSVSGDKSLVDLGEVVVCPAVVFRYSEDEGGDLGRQMAWTLMHGVLHLVGYDHEQDNGEMRRREQVLLEELDRLVRAVSLGADR